MYDDNTLRNRLDRSTGLADGEIWYHVSASALPPTLAQTASGEDREVK